MQRHTYSYRLSEEERKLIREAVDSFVEVLKTRVREQQTTPIENWDALLRTNLRVTEETLLCFEGIQRKLKGNGKPS